MSQYFPPRIQWLVPGGGAKDEPWWWGVPTTDLPHRRHTMFQDLDTEKLYAVFDDGEVKLLAHHSPEDIKKSIGHGTWMVFPFNPFECDDPATEEERDEEKWKRHWEHFHEWAWKEKKQAKFKSDCGFSKKRDYKQVLRK